ncbi:TKL family protein kinase [Tritrichomonas foetus]|uniref:TKL family protein kinase n=1 Tax=Tritrichomonas foetus TaxID=1144522 RepID=A0A1J4KRL6_9EUKA|nr:TKL family protein kinase [Tritrichomonas foetus]|eukprot:OHT13899.1 TKL family protein kinase [Tritrichomonas foetus]
MNEFQKQLDLISSRILTLSHANPPPYIHCSKINCFLLQIKEVSRKSSLIKIDSNKKMTNTMRHNFSNLMNVLSQFQQLHSQCCGDLCAQFALTSSMRNVRNEISSIRRDCIKYLENIGLQSISSTLYLDDIEYDSQDKVDIKRIAVILNHLQMRPEIAKRDDVAGSLINRLNSLDALGITITSDESDSVAFPDLPSLLNYVVKYEDIEFGPLIGEGEAGKVFRGKINKKLAKNFDVAIKILHRRSLSTYDLEMYRREIFSMSVLIHPSLVRFCGYTTEPPFCVLTEYMENGSLYDFLYEHPNNLTATHKTLIALDIARGLEFLHGRGVIHRDLKSLNILLDGRKRAKICDFGLIRMKTNDPMTGLVGTSHWMAPEVLMSSPYYDEKVDIYSFGILMWELLTNERPYENDCLDAAQITMMILEQNKRPPIPPNTPPDLKRLIERCWDRDPKLRPSCHEIIADLSKLSFQFPGCELVLLMQESGLIRSRHNYSSSSPISFNKNQHWFRSPNIECRITTKHESFARSLRRVSDSLSLGHIEHIENAINQLKLVLRRQRNDSNQLSLFFPQYTSLISSASPKFRPKLIQILFEMLSLPVAKKLLDFSIISKFLRSNENQVIDVVMTQLAMNPDPDFLCDDTISALLEFSSNPNQPTRVKALTLLLYAADSRFDEILMKPTFSQEILSFTCRKLPHSILKMMLNTLLKLFKQVHEITPLTVQRLAKIMPTTPYKYKSILLSCIEELMKFDIMKKSVDVFQNAADEYEYYGKLFQIYQISMKSEPPSAEILSILFSLSENEDDVFQILIYFISNFPDIKDNIIELLPVNNKNEQLLANFYCHLLDNEVILRYQEFYVAAAVLLDSEYFHPISFLLANPNSKAEFIKESLICQTINKFVIDEIQDREFLNLMFNLCCKSAFNEFVYSTPKLFSNMRNSKDSEVVKLSYLCLAVIAKFNTEEFDFDLLLRYAAKAVNTQSGFVQTASSFLFKSFITKANCPKVIADIFIETFSEATKPASTVANVLVEFMKSEINGSIREEDFLKLKHFAEI